jgi:hypothetical protein
MKQNETKLNIIQIFPKLYLKFDFTDRGYVNGNLQ